MNINITKFHPSAILPQYQTVGAAGADIHACIDAPIVLQPMDLRERQLLHRIEGGHGQGAQPLHTGIGHHGRETGFADRHIICPRNPRSGFGAGDEITQACPDRRSGEDRLWQGVGEYR